MKKYTKRLNRDFHNIRVWKNYIAALLPMIAAVKVLILHSNAWPIITAALLGGTITIVGEFLYNLAMSWIETCESIQEKEEKDGTI